MARLLTDPAYADRLNASESVDRTFGEHCFSTHLFSNSPFPGRSVQLPWPKTLGTAPWSVAIMMSKPYRYGVPGTRYRVRFAWPGHEDDLLTKIADGLAKGYSVPIFVGNRWCPRHVALVVDADPGALICYDPSSGHRVRIANADTRNNRMGLAGWDRLWLAVLPTRRN